MDYLKVPLNLKIAQQHICPCVFFFLGLDLRGLIAEAPVRTMICYALGEYLVSDHSVSSYTHFLLADGQSKGKELNTSGSPVMGSWTFRRKSVY